MKFTNADVIGALRVMTHLCGGGNRLETLPALRASRIRDALARAAEPVEELRMRLISDRGGQLNEAMGRYEFTDPAADAEVNRLYLEGLREERDLELEALTLQEVEAGHYRDPATGKKEKGLDLSPDQIGLLVRLGIVIERAPVAVAG